MEKEFITNSAEETRSFGNLLAKSLKKGSVICLSGELGSGKTTFAQGFLGGFDVPGPYTSPTFLIMKHYEKKSEDQNIKNIYHLDAYRVEKDDILDLGWEEIISDPESVVIVEWAERINEIIPDDAMWIIFEWIDKDRRKIKL